MGLSFTVAAVAAVLLSGLWLANPSGVGVEIIAHRGASLDAPENTLAALRLGFEQGADAGELDVHVSKDGELVVIHDATTKRTAGVDRPVAGQTLAELRALDVGGFGRWKGKGFSEPVPTLDEVFPLVPAGRRLFIEIKCGVEALPPLEQALRHSRLTADQTVIITFHYDVAEAAERRFPGVQVYWLHGYAKDEKTGQHPDLDDLIRRAKAAGVDGLNLNHQFPLDRAAVGRVKAAGLKCHVWTVDDAARARDLVRAGVDGITTNRPAGLRNDLRASP